MSDYFHGWRRKIGVFTLVVACVLAAGWVRSLSLQDTFMIPFGDKTSVQYVSAYHRIVLGIHRTITGAPLRKRPLWRSIPADRACWQQKIELMTGRVEFGSFMYGNNGLVFNTGIYSRYLELPYWWIVVPLLALSAYLLLGKSWVRQARNHRDRR